MATVDQRDAGVYGAAGVAGVAGPTCDHRLAGSCLMLFRVLQVPEQS